MGTPLLEEQRCEVLVSSASNSALVQVRIAMLLTASDRTRRRKRNRSFERCVKAPSSRSSPACACVINGDASLESVDLCSTVALWRSRVNRDPAVVCWVVVVMAAT